MNYKIVMITALIVVVINYAILWFKYKKIERRVQCLEPATVIKPIKAEHLRMSVNEQPKKSLKAIGLDATKRRSLHPSNQMIIPDGFKEVARNLDGDVLAYLEKRLPIAFQYKFFGSNLMINGEAVMYGLTNRLHIMEVSEDNQVTIDGQEKPFHPDIIESIRNIARGKE